MHLLVGSLVVAASAGLALAAASEPAGPARATPRVVAILTDGKVARAALRCIDGASPRSLALGPAMSPYGLPPSGDRAVAQIVRKDAVVQCTAGEGGATGALRLRPMLVRAVSPRVARDDKGARLVVSLDGQALGPRSATDDGVYLVWHGQVLLLDASCPEAAFTDTHVVACAALDRVAGRGPARVRLQSAGRLEEAAGAPIDIDTLVGGGGR